MRRAISNSTVLTDSKHWDDSSNPDLKDSCRAFCALAFRENATLWHIFPQRATCSAKSLRQLLACTGSNGHRNDTSTYRDEAVEVEIRRFWDESRGSREAHRTHGGRLWRTVRRRKSWSAGLQVNGGREAPAGSLRQAPALLFYHLGDKSSTDSQLIFNTAQTTRHSLLNTSEWEASRENRREETHD